MGRPKKEYVYSSNGEDFFDLDAVLGDLNDEYEPGEKVKIFKGESKPYKHIDFIDAWKIIEEFQACAYEAGGDWSEEYLQDVPEDKIESLRDTINRWLSKHAKQPSFCTVINIKEIEIEIPDV